MYTIYHNPRCGASREALKILHERGGEVRVVEYLKSCPSRGELSELIEKLCIKAEDLVRKKEPVFKEKYAGKKLTEAQWIAAMVNDPILIERPIIVRDGKAVIGRGEEEMAKIMGSVV